MDELKDAEPYFEEQYQIGRFLIRKTKGQTPFLRFQAGRNEIVERNYVSRGMTGRGFSGAVVVYHLLGFGETEDEAIQMAVNRG